MESCPRTASRLQPQPHLPLVRRALSATCTRGDLRGVTSLVRALGLRQACYDRLLDFFHSRGVDLPCLTRCWAALILKTLRPFLLIVNGRIVLLADGIKAPKTGKKMPGVKKLHQESQNNTKPEYIFGHSCQALAIVVKAASSFFALPLACRIHEGVVFSNRDRRTLLDKLVALLASLGISLPAYLVADAYYASAKIILPLLKAGLHLVTAAQTNAVAYEPAEEPRFPRRGRHRLYGRKVKLKQLFDDESLFTQADSPIYGDRNVTLRYRVVDLLWRPVGIRVRFVLVIHPERGLKILLCTDLSLEPIQIIQLYGVRFKIEVAFKQAVHTIGTYSYLPLSHPTRGHRPGTSPRPRHPQLSLRLALLRVLAPHRSDGNPSFRAGRCCRVAPQPPAISRGFVTKQSPREIHPPAS